MSQPDFNSLACMQAPMDDIKAPPPLPVGDYLGIIKSHEFGESGNQTPYVRFHLGLLEWPASVPEAERTTDLSKLSKRKDFYLTDEAAYRLKNFLSSLGIKAKNLPEAIPQATGCQVIITMKEYINKRVEPPEIGTAVDNVIGA